MSPEMEREGEAERSLVRLAGICYRAAREHVRTAQRQPDAANAMDGAMLGSTLNYRYRLEQRLGTVGQQYLATDAASGEMLTVRFLPRHVSLRGEGGLRYRLALARIKGLHHPHLLVPVEAASAGGTAFLAAPYYPSQTLTDVLAAGSLTISETTLLLQQVAGALEVLHGTGVVHGGVQLDNLLISREDGFEAVLSNPALSLLVPPGEESVQAAQFRAPEESPAVEAEPGARSDLYALGMVGWRLLAGDLPFHAPTPSAAYQHHLATPPPDPRTRNAEIPARLAAIVMKLLAKAPERRYQSAAGLRADLETWQQAGDRALGERDQLRPFTQAQPVLGRETGREALLAGLGRAAAGQGSMVLLAGASGMGKGRLFRAVQPHLLAGEALVLRARPPGPEACPPYFLVQAWCEDLLSLWDLLPDLRRRDLLYRLHQALGSNGRLLSAIVPALEPLLPQSGPPAPLPPPRDHLRVLNTIADALAALADPRHPLVLWVEDLEHIDGDSLAVLRFLADRLPDTALLFAAGYAAGSGSPAGAAGQWLQEPGTRRHLAWVELPPLSNEHIEQATAALLAVPWHEPPPQSLALVSALAGWLEQHWGGVPLNHEAALRLLAARGILAPDSTHRDHALPWRLDGEALAAWRPPATAGALLREWLGILPDALVQVLEAAATCPGPIALDPLGALLEGFPEEALVEQLDAAVRQGILYRARDGLRFTEARVRQAIEECTAPVRRQHFHQALGAALESRPEAGALQVHHQAAWHFTQGADRERATSHTAALLAAALDAGAPQGAVGAFRRLPEAARQRVPHAVFTHLVAAAAAAGHPQAAGDLVAARLASVEEDGERADLLVVQGQLAGDAGDLPAAGAVLEQALAALGESLPQHAVGSALARLADGAARRYGEFMSTAAGGAPAPLSPEEERRCRALEANALAFWRSDAGRAAAADERILRVAGHRLTSGWVLRALIRLGRAEEHPDAQPLLEAEELLHKTDLPCESVALLLAVGQGALAQFQLARAWEAFDSARERARALGDLFAVAEAELGLFELARLQGPAEGLSRAAARLVALGTLTRSAQVGAHAQAAHALAQATVGTLPVEQALSPLLAAAEHFAERAWPDAARYWLAATLELLLATGVTGEARRCFGLADRLTTPLSMLAHGRLTAALVEWHLVLADALPDQPHPRQQARAGLRALRPLARERALLAVLLEGQSALERIAQGDVSEGLAQMEVLEPALEAQGARALWGRLCLRVAEALKPSGDKTWLAWGGKGLMAFDAAGAAAFAQALRRLLDVAPPGDPADAPAHSGMAPLGTGLLPLFERIAAEGSQPQDALHEALLRHLLEQGDGERAALYLPNADGQLALVYQFPVADLGQDPFNRWMVETVRREGRGQVADHYLPPAADPALDALQEAQSVLCLPLGTPGRVQGVAALSSSRSRRVYDGADVARLGHLARQVGLLLALNTALGSHTALRRSEAEQIRQGREMMAWSQRAAGGATAQDILTDYFHAVAQPLGFEAAVLWRLERPPRRQLVPRLMALGAPMAAATLAALPSEGADSQAAAALRTLAPVTLSGGAGPQPSAGEQALYNQWRARDAVWLPLTVRGDPAGLVLLLARERRALPAQRLETHLLAPLQAVAPALVRTLQAEDLRVEQAALQERQAELEQTEGRLRRFLPGALDGTRPFPDRPGAAVEVELPVLAGRVQALSRLARLGAVEWSRALEAYFQRVGQGLELHQGLLDRTVGGAWWAHFPGGVNNALWSAHTLAGLLGSLAQDQADAGLVPLRTGLGVHLGPVLAGTVAVAERLQPVWEGEGVRAAQDLAEMAGQLRCGVLVSGEAAAGVEASPGIAVRPFGPMRLGAGERRIEVFDVYSVRPAETVAAMRALQEVWEQAMRRFRLGEWDEAAPLFRHYAARLPEDRPARYFLRRCRLRRKQAGPLPPPPSA